MISTDVSETDYTSSIRVMIGIDIPPAQVYLGMLDVEASEY